MFNYFVYLHVLIYAFTTVMVVLLVILSQTGAMNVTSIVQFLVLYDSGRMQSMLTSPFESTLAQITLPLIFYCFTVYFECYFCLCNVCINVIFIVYACTYYGRPTNFEFNKVYFKYVFLGAVELWYCFLGSVADCVGVCISFNHLNTIIIYYYLCIVTVNGKFHVKKNGGCDIQQIT